MINAVLWGQLEAHSLGSLIYVITLARARLHRADCLHQPHPATSARAPSSYTSASMQAQCSSSSLAWTLICPPSLLKHSSLLNNKKIWAPCVRWGIKTIAFGIRLTKSQSLPLTMALRQIFCMACFSHLPIVTTT